MVAERRNPLVVIFTAIPVEHRAVQAHINNVQEEIHPQGTIYTHGVFATPRGSWDVAIVQIGMGNAVAALEGERAVNHLRPDGILFVGVAGGVKDVRIGDVVAATKVYGYEAGKVEHDSFRARPNVVRPTYRMEQRARVVARQNKWFHQLIGPSPTQIPVAHIGPIASGEKVLASTHSSLWAFLQSHYNDTLAVEMEGHGLLSVAYANPQLEALVVRGISDLINEKNRVEDTLSQEIAARHASAFAFAVLDSLSEDERFKGQNGDNKTDEGVAFVVHSPRPEKQIDLRQLRVALLSAFPTRQELRILVDDELQQNLDAIASDSNQETTIFELIRWARSRGYIERLLQAALNSRPGNPDVQAIAKQAGLELPTFSPPSSIAQIERRSLQKDAPVKYRIHNSNDRLVFETDINSNTIFVARDEQVESFHALLRTWHSIDLSVANEYVHEVPLPGNKLQGPVVLIYQLKRSLPVEAKGLFEEYEIQIIENLHRKKLSHDPEMLRSEQKKLLTSLDKLSGQYCGRKFQELCFSTKVINIPSTVSSTSAHQSSVPDEATHISVSPMKGTERRKQILIEPKVLTPILPTRHFYYKTKDFPSPISISINNDYQGCTDVTLRVHVWIEGYSDLAIQTITIDAGQEQTVSLMPLLKPDMIATLDKAKPATLYIQTFSGNELIAPYTKIIDLHARNTALLAVKAPDGRPVDLTDGLAAWVTPHDAQVETLLRQAADYHNHGEFVGYPQGQSLRKSIGSVRKQAQAIFDVLRYGLKLKYVESSSNFGTQNEQIAQRVRLPSDVLSPGGSANCLDGALLFASLLELATIDPVILLLPGHSIVGWHTGPDEEQYEFVDTTLIPKEDFTTARLAGQQHYKRAVTQKLFEKEVFDFTGFARLIDIKSCRDRGIYDN